ncbi:MAG: hypothetical protein KDK40_04435, partial [Chlamydiia bacterium]|nr:hypothetical protein [Chlamydiia bacterium]
DATEAEQAQGEQLKALPAELMAEIIAKAGAEGRAKLCLTCRCFYRLANETAARLNRPIDIYGGGEAIIKHVARWGYREMNIVTSSPFNMLINHINEIDGDFSPLAKNALKAVMIPHISKKSFYSLIKVCPSLLTLRIDGRSLSVEEEYALCRGCSRLQSLTYRNEEADIEPFLTRLPHLTSINGLALDYNLKKCSSLRRLNYSNFSGVDNLTKNCSNLISLELSQGNISGEDLATLSNFFTKLQSLMLININLDASNSGECGSGFTELKTLVLDFKSIEKWNVSDYFRGTVLTELKIYKTLIDWTYLFEWVCKCTDLSTLEIKGGFDKLEHYEKIFKHCLHLKRVVFDDIKCKELSCLDVIKSAPKGLKRLRFNDCYRIRNEYFFPEIDMKGNFLEIGEMSLSMLPMGLTTLMLTEILDRSQWLTVLVLDSIQEVTKGHLKIMAEKLPYLRELSLENVDSVTGDIENNFKSGFPELRFLNLYAAEHYTMYENPKAKESPKALTHLRRVKICSNGWIIGRYNRVDRGIALEVLPYRSESAPYREPVVVFVSSIQISGPAVVGRSWGKEVG